MQKFVSPSRLLALLVLALLLPAVGGCILLPFVADHDTSEVDRSIERSEAARRSRMQSHSRISSDEYRVMHSGPNPGGTQPPPSQEELKAQVEAEQNMRHRRAE